MKTLIVAFILTLFVAPSLAFDVHLAWDPSPSPDVIDYEVSWGTESRTYTEHFKVGTSLDCRVVGLEDGIRHYFSVRAWDAEDLHSDYCNEVSTDGTWAYVSAPAHPKGDEGGGCFIATVAEAAVFNRPGECFVLIVNMTPERQAAGIADAMSDVEHRIFILAPRSRVGSCKGMMLPTRNTYGLFLKKKDGYWEPFNAFSIGEACLEQPIILEIWPEQ